MRDIDRIPKVILIFKKNKDLLDKFIENKKNSDIVFKKLDAILEFWQKYPDLRFGQLLCNLRYIDNLETENRIWNIEEVNWLRNKGYNKL